MNFFSALTLGLVSGCALASCLSPATRPGGDGVADSSASIHDAAWPHFGADSPVQDLAQEREAWSARNAVRYNFGAPLFRECVPYVQPGAGDESAAFTAISHDHDTATGHHEFWATVKQENMESTFTPLKVGALGDMANSVTLPINGEFALRVHFDPNDGNYVLSLHDLVYHNGEVSIPGMLGVGAIREVDLSSPSSIPRVPYAAARFERFPQSSYSTYEFRAETELFKLDVW